MTQLTSALMVTFDFTQRGKSGTGLAAASLIAACHKHEGYGEEFIIEHLPIKMPEAPEIIQPENVVRAIETQQKIDKIDRLILACYVWSSHLIEPVIALCKQKGFTGKVILGGYQVTKDTCKELYPSGDYYITSYAEFALPIAILDNTAITSILVDSTMDKNSDFIGLPSPYLSGAYQIEQNQEMIHWETHRGCVFKCNFCVHRDLQTGSVFDLDKSRIEKELKLFNTKNIKKINVLDPVFNRGPNHIETLETAVKIGLKSQLSLQTRFEMINEEFLNLCAQLNVYLEFGLQTAIEKEFKVIDRPNNLIKVKEAITLLKKWNQSFEVSLIYGLPNQTVSSFKESIRFLHEQGITNIKAFPLMLLEGTDLKKNQDKYGLKEGYIDDSRIPHVIESNTFTRSQWEVMHLIAKNLQQDLQQNTEVA